MKKHTETKERRTGSGSEVDVIQNELNIDR